jgi:hypothetical protein
MNKVKIELEEWQLAMLHNLVSRKLWEHEYKGDGLYDSDDNHIARGVLSRLLDSLSHSM